MKELQEQIVSQARTWLRTPFHHQAWLKGKGCDCLGLIVGVVDELGLKDKAPFRGVKTPPRIRNAYAQKSPSAKCFRNIWSVTARSKNAHGNLMSAR